MSKPIILEIDNVRIRRWDDQNLFVEREETYWNPKEKQQTTGYRFKGYYYTVSACLREIARKELLIDENNSHDLKSVLNQIEISNQKIVDAIERMDAE